MDYRFDLDFARSQDAHDPLARFRDAFHFPTFTGGPCYYFTGNSLGLQPRKAKDYLNEELDDWARWGVEGHTKARRPWLRYHEYFAEGMAALTGADPTEVVAMNGLTVNLHLLMATFYRPQGRRTKILCEGKAFPSDQYALHSQLRWHGLDPAEHLVEVQPDPESGLIDEEELIGLIDEHRDELALVMIGGVNYYSGQWFAMERITDAGKRAGAMVGWDLAHAVGNVPLHLHKWNVDFAAWCSYKYLNAGPGAVSGVFIHRQHHDTSDLPRLEGWWGHDKDSRFAMPDRFKPIPSAEAWQLSNAPVFSMAPLLASLELFAEAGGISALRKKSLLLTGYLHFVMESLSRESGQNLKILGPKEPEKRGCQLSLVVPERGRKVFEALSAKGVVADWREPAVIRLAPVPLYNSFEDVYRFGEILAKILKDEAEK